MLDIKGTIQAIGNVKTWKQVVVVLALIAASLAYFMRNNPSEVQEYYQNGKLQKISKYR